MNMTKRALIIVDLQNDYFPGGKWTLTGIEAAAANAARLLQSARAAGHLVVHVCHESPKSDAAFFVAGSEGAAIAPQVINKEGEHVVLKHQINAFRDTDLKNILDTNGIEEVVIAGAMSHMCVDAITRASADFGYKATVIHDAVATLDMEFNGVKVPAAHVHAAFMAALGFAYATMLSMEQYISA
jgi:nicotinamidase-related amidase